MAYHSTVSTAASLCNGTIAVAVAVAVALLLYNVTGRFFREEKYVFITVLPNIFFMDISGSNRR
jgi:hypothetical protein